MIKVDTIEEGLPISVIVPLSQKRKPFFHEFVLPMIEANNPIEIIINDNEGTAPQKRNAGFLKSTQPFVFFCDDDILLPMSHLQKLFDAINSGNYGFAYSGYKGIVVHKNNHPIGDNFDIPTIEFSYDRLKKGNYISTMSLIRREVFPMFDESLKRLQDYDLWLTICKNGHLGKAVFNNEYFAYYLDEGITSNGNNETQAILTIINKHKIGM
jgi:glycosyltransferase involved in cell wall biosynthesis